jgi:hypothetical protein
MLTEGKGGGGDWRRTTRCDAVRRDFCHTLAVRFLLAVLWRSHKPMFILPFGFFVRFGAVSLAAPVGFCGCVLEILRWDDVLSRRTDIFLLRHRNRDEQDNF